jgi:hypothetical protein
LGHGIEAQNRISSILAREVLGSALSKSKLRIFSRLRANTSERSHHSERREVAQGLVEHREDLIVASVADNPRGQDQLCVPE